MNDGPNVELVVATLHAAVPMWIEKLKSLSYAQILERAKVCGQHVAEHGDIIQFKSKKKGETAEAFNRLAEGIACLAFSPGGVTFLGQHWEAKHEGSR